MLPASCAGHRACRSRPAPHQPLRPLASSRGLPERSGLSAHRCFSSRSYGTAAACVYRLRCRLLANDLCLASRRGEVVTTGPGRTAAFIQQGADAEHPGSIVLAECPAEAQPEPSTCRNPAERHHRNPSESRKVPGPRPGSRRAPASASPRVRSARRPCPGNQVQEQFGEPGPDLTVGDEQVMGELVEPPAAPSSAGPDPDVPVGASKNMPTTAAS